jgi:WD40 repeat protein
MTSRSVDLCAFSGKGDLIAIGYPTRIALVNSSGRGARGGVNLGGIPVMAMDTRGEFILTSDPAGVSLRQLPESPSEMLTANRRVVIPGPRWRALAVTADGSRVWAANASSNMVYAFSRDFTSEGIALGPHEFVDTIAVSPDGRWVAGGSSLLHSVKVWNVESRETALTMDAGRFHRLAFSGDSRWLAVHGDLFELRRVGSWQPAPPLPYPGAQPALGSAAFSPDGRILAVVEEQENIRLFDLVTWKFLGLLRSPVSGSINGLAFSPDSTTLAAACGQGRLRIWNLKAIRSELAALNLDWELPVAGP